MRSFDWKSWRALPADERLEALWKAAPEVAALMNRQNDTLGDSAERLEGFSENVLGAFPLPLSVVPMRVNGRDRLIPLATEEAGLVAGIAKASKLSGEDGFTVRAGINHVQAIALIADVPDAAEWPKSFDEPGARAGMLRDTLRHALTSAGGDPFVKHGGGITCLLARRLGQDIELLVGGDTAEAMGAAGITRIAETVAREFAVRSGGTAVSAIVANAGSGRHVRAEAAWDIGGAMTAAHAARLIKVCVWASQSELRAATHNKGVLNGMAAAATAFGQDLRAIHASAGSSAGTMGGLRGTLSRITAGDGRITGSLSAIIPCGTVGGATQMPVAAICRNIAGIKDAADLAAVIAACGLAANFASLLQLSRPEGFSATYDRLKRQP